MKKRVVRIVVAVLLLGVFFGGAGFGIVLWRIHQSVRNYTKVAQKAHPHPGNDVAALTEFMNSDAHSLRERNLAVWTLGRLSDATSLTALESIYTGKPCEHDTNLCQYELAKAIKRCGGIPNPPPRPTH